MRNFVRIAVAATLAAPSVPAAPKDLSADLVMIQGGQKMDTMKVFVAGDKSRTETSLTGNSINIVRKDKSLMWTLFPDKKLYMEQPLTAQTLSDPSGDPPGLIKKEKAGRETVNGRSCTKFLYTIEHPMTKRQMTANWWIADDLGIGIKSEIMGLTTELHNIKLGTPPAHLFEVPPGYQKTDKRPGMPASAAEMKEWLKKGGRPGAAPPTR